MIGFLWSCEFSGGVFYRVVGPSQPITGMQWRSSMILWSVGSGSTNLHKSTKNYRPRKLKWNPKNGGLEDVFSLPKADV